MNIHINDSALFERLKKSSLVKIEVGSSMYGISDENSDVDYLYVYVPSEMERNSFHNSHHQLQYKENDIDYNFVNIFSFIRNSLSGDSTINFEAIHSGCLKGTVLEFLYEMRNSFSNYKILRSYLGLANRDLKHIKLQNTIRDKNKRICHALRGLQFYRDVINCNFNPLIERNSSLYEEISIIKKLETDKERALYINKLKSDIDTERDNLNKSYHGGTFEFAKLMKIEDQKLLDDNIKILLESEIYKSKLGLEIDMNLFYNVNENVELKYD